jgi:hypothetical protein
MWKALKEHKIPSGRTALENKKATVSVVLTINSAH